MLVWGHDCRYSRIMRYQPLLQPEHSEMSQVKHVSTDTQPMLSDTATSHPTTWTQEVLISPTSYQMCWPSQLKTLWRRTELTHRAQLGTCQKVSGRGAISPQLQSAVSNLVGPKYLESVTGWKGRILVVKITILSFKK